MTENQQIAIKTRNLPPPPSGIRRYGDSPDQARAEGIKKVTDPTAAAMTASLREGQLPIISFLLLMGRDPDLNVDFPEEYANIVLEQSSNVIMKTGGRRLEILNEMCKEPQFPMQGGGFFGGVKQRLGIGQRY